MKNQTNYFKFYLVITLLGISVFISSNAEGNSITLAAQESIQHFKLKIDELPLKPVISLIVCPEGPPTCDFEKIQDAIDALPQTPPVWRWDFNKDSRFEIPRIEIQPGTYVESLNITKSIWIKGAGAEQVIISNPFSVGDVEFFTIPLVNISSLVRQAIFIEGLNFEDIFFMRGAFFGILENNKFDGAYLDGSLDMTLYENDFDGQLKIYGSSPLFSGGGFNNNTALIASNTFRRVNPRQVTSLDISQTIEVVIRENDFSQANDESDGGIGVVSTFSFDIDISHNRFNGISGVAIQRGGEGITITNNQLSDIPGFGISLHSGIVDGNRIQGDGSPSSEGVVWTWFRSTQLELSNNTISNFDVGLDLPGPTPELMDALTSKIDQMVCEGNRFENNSQNIDVFFHDEFEDVLQEKCHIY